jgi:hypothetical protein
MASPNPYECGGLEKTLSKFVEDLVGPVNQSDPLDIFGERKEIELRNSLAK